MLIKMRVPDQDAERWVAILKHAENGMADANLQDIVEPIGKKADALLENLIDVYGMENAFRIESWWVDKCEFEFILISPKSKHKKDFFDFLVSCGVSNISVNEDFDW